MTDVFFSYRSSRYDKDAFVRPLVEALEAAGWSVWIDATGIGHGQDIPDEVVAALGESKLLLAYYTDDYADSRVCQWELTSAFLVGQAEGDVDGRIVVVTQPGASFDHVHPVELRTDKSARVDEIESVVAAVKHKLASIAKPLGTVAALRPGSWSPRESRMSSTQFVGRVPKLWDVHSALHAGGQLIVTGARTTPAAVTGLGGVGKTMLAAEYADRFGAAYPGGVVWLRAATADKEGKSLAQQQLRTVAVELELEVEGLTPEQVEARVWSHLAGEGRTCLVVVDDFPHDLGADAMQSWRAPGAVGPTLFTTRSRGYTGIAESVDLDVLGPEDAKKLLTSRVAPKGEAEKQAAAALCEIVGFHPLALALAAAQVERSGDDAPFEATRARLADTGGDRLERIAERLKSAGEVLPTNHELSVTKTLLTSIDRLGEAGRAFLDLASVGGAAPWPGALVASAFARMFGVDEPEAAELRDDAFAQVDAHSLSQPGEAREGGRRSVHALVARVAGIVADEATGARARAALRGAVLEVLPASADIRAHASIESAVEHARAVVDERTEVGLEVIGWVARFDVERGDYRAARAGFASQLRGREAALGPEHPDTLTSMNNLASTFKAQGELARAMPIAERVLAIRRRTLGANHVNTVISMINLANLLGGLGNLARARELGEQAKEISSRILGEEHPSTIASMDALVTTMRAQGDLGTAQMLGNRALEVSLRTLGSEHPETVASMSNLALTLCDQGDFAGARALYERALEIQIRTFGAEHPNTLTSINNLASTLRRQGNLVGARALEESALEIVWRRLGREHPHTMTSMSNLAATMFAQGDLAGARPIQEDVLEISRRTLGAEHPDTVASMNNLAVTRKAQGDLSGAEALQKEALEIIQRTLGAEHPDTVKLMSNLAATLFSLGDRAGARTLEEGALEISRRVLGPAHPNTIGLMSNLAQTLKAQGDLPGTLLLQQDALEIISEVLGLRHPDTTVLAWNLLSTLLDLEEHQLAVQILTMHLVWLLEADPQTLGADQRTIRGYVSSLIQPPK